MLIVLPAPLLARGVIVAGGGALVAAAAQLHGVGGVLVPVTGTGALIAGAAQLHGVGGVGAVITGAGSLIAGAAQLSGSDAGVSGTTTVLSASRAGLGSVVVQPAASKTQVISNVGAVS